MASVCQLETEESVSRFARGIQALLARYADTLLDDAGRTGSWHSDQRLLWRNTADYAPWLWVWAEGQDAVLAVGALSDVQAGQQAYLHGVSHPDCRGTSRVVLTLLPLLQTAFGPLGLHSLKAEVEADNRGAVGFCRRFGFRREAYFPERVAVGGRLRDVIVYSLSASAYRDSVLPGLLRHLQRWLPIGATELAAHENRFLLKGQGL